MFMTTECYEQNCKLHMVQAQMASRLAITEEIAIVEAELSAQLRLALCKAIRIYPHLGEEEFIQRALQNAERILGGEFDELLEAITVEEEYD